MWICGSFFLYLLNNFAGFFITRRCFLNQFFEIIERKRMDTDMGIDDKFLARQTYAVIWNLTFKKSFFWNPLAFPS